MRLDRLVKLDYLIKVNMPSHQRMLEEIPRRLAELLGLPPAKVRARPANEPGIGKAEADLVLDAGPRRFAVACKADGTVAPISAAARAARGFAERLGKKAIPMVVAPFMGEVGRQLCAAMAVNWMDFSGNASIEAPGLRIQFKGHPNQFKRRGRPGSLFAPKSSRIAHWLLLHPEQAFTQRELARAVGMGEGFVSRVARGLEEKELVAREPGGALRVGDYNMLLQAWREDYDFSRHSIVRGHLAARSSDEILRRLAERFEEARLQYAVTGLAGAWLWTHFAGFRLVVFYVARNPGASALEQIGFHEEERGENVWLVVPNDAGVFLGASDRDGVRCVDPAQLYVDLKDQPERSAEAAEHLLKEILIEKPHA
jgi:hypothetical protein